LTRTFGIRNGAWTVLGRVVHLRKIASIGTSPAND
jgi:hypothetical protein